MPLFDRKCNKCGKVLLDQLEKGVDSDSNPCECGGQLHRSFGNSAPKIKYIGVGWNHSSHEIS